MTLPTTSSSASPEACPVPDKDPSRSDLLVTAFRQTLPVLVFLSVLLIILLVLLDWSTKNQVNDFTENQRQIAHQAVSSLADEIEELLQFNRKMARHLAEEHTALLQYLADNPADPDALELVRPHIREYFPQTINFALADDRGRVIVAEHPERIGRACRSDIRAQAIHHHPNPVYIHSNPKPEHYHYDILAPVEGLLENRDGVLFLSLSTDKLRDMLQDDQPFGHQFLLLTPGTGGYRVQLSGSGTDGDPEARSFIDAADLAHFDARMPVPGTAWILADRVDPGLLAGFRKKLWIDALLTSLGFVVMAALFYLAILRKELRNQRNALHIHQLNASLEERVRARTRELEDKKQELAHQANHDYLTGLLNRRGFEKRFRVLLKEACGTNTPAALLYMDLDQFKLVNDTAGHAAGDHMLRQIATLFKSMLRKSDVLARLGGDEFALLLHDCDMECALGIAKKIQNSIRTHQFRWGDQVYSLSLSIGIVPIHCKSCNEIDLLSKADACCYRAKELGRDQIHVFSPDDSALITQDSNMRAATQALYAIRNDRYALFGQQISPIAEDVGTTWYEILIRITASQDKLIPPGSFIPALEQFGGIKELDRRVLTEAMRLHALNPDCTLNVNLSGYSLNDPDFLSLVEQCAIEFPQSPPGIVLEITETAAVDDLAQTKKFIVRIHELGFRIALDDFGAGMSSFSSLQELDVDYIKLDGRFIRGLDKSHTQRAMVEAVHKVSRVMRKPVIAEFVEDERIVSLLKHIGVEFGQGWAFHRPQPIEGLLFGSPFAIPPRDRK